MCIELLFVAREQVFEEGEQWSSCDPVVRRQIRTASEEIRIPLQALLEGRDHIKFELGRYHAHIELMTAELTQARKQMAKAKVEESVQTRLIDALQQELSDTEQQASTREAQTVQLDLRAKV